MNSYDNQRKEPAELVPYLDAQGRVNRWPARKYRKSQRAVLEFLAAKFETGKVYSERQVNALLKLYHTFGDAALLRRELMEGQLLARKRDGSAYWNNE